MFTKSEGMGDVGITVPMFSKPVEGGFQLCDPSQQMPLLAFNFSPFEVECRLWADGVEKQSYTLGVHDPNAKSMGADGDSQINALIFISGTANPQFAGMGNQPMVVVFHESDWVEIKAQFTVKRTGQAIELLAKFRFAPPGQEVNYIEVLGQE